MQVGDLVKVHWGNCDWSGKEDVDWGYSSGVVMGEVTWWDDNKQISPCGEAVVLERGQEVNYNIGRLEVLA